MSKVLIVDDSPTVLAAITMHLEKAGYTVATHNRALGTLLAVLKESPDVILLDIGMRSLSGDEICKLIKKDEGSSRTLVFFYSSLSEESLEQKVRESGADGFIHKSWDAERLLETLKAALE